MFASMGKIAAMRIEDEAKMRSAKKGRDAWTSMAEQFDMPLVFTKLDAQRVVERLRQREHPKVGQVCGVDLLLDLSDIPKDLRYEKYFEARTVLEDIIKKELKENRP